MRKKILIVGGSGFIGTNICIYFTKKTDYDLLNIDIAKPKADICRYSKVDITDFDELRPIIINFSPDYIIHLAARTDLCGKNLDDYSANTTGVRNLMQIVKELPCLKKVIITSSMLVCHSGYYPQSQFDYAPTTVYGASKVETEKNVWENPPACDWAIIRPTSIWGPWFGEPYRNFFDMIISHKYFHIGNRGCTKTYGYVGNAVYQILQILFEETTDSNKKIYYIGDAPATNIEEWGNEIANELGYNITKVPFYIVKIAAWGGDLLKKFGVYFPMTSFRLRNMTTDNIINLDDTYFIAPSVPFNRIDGIRQTLNWIKMNKIS